MFVTMSKNKQLSIILRKLTQKDLVQKTLFKEIGRLTANLSLLSSKSILQSSPPSLQQTTCYGPLPPCFHLQGMRKIFCSNFPPPIIAFSQSSTITDTPQGSLTRETGRLTPDLHLLFHSSKSSYPVLSPALQPTTYCVASPHSLLLFHGNRTDS